MNLILASGSPRRKALMAVFSYPFTVCVSHIDETMAPDLPVPEAVAQVSRRKALAVSRQPEDVVVAADTVVVCDGAVLGKPATEQEAYRMLSALSGRSHQVMTGMTVLRGCQAVTCTEITKVFFRPLTPGEIRRYIRSGEPMDKAGAYGIQGGAGLFVERLEGDYFNVMGLPICRLGQIFRELAPEIMEETK